MIVGKANEANLVVGLLFTSMRVIYNGGTNILRTFKMKHNTGARAVPQNWGQHFLHCVMPQGCDIRHGGRRHRHEERVFLR